MAELSHGSIRWRAPLWASGQIAVQIYRDLPSLILLFYMTEVLKIPPAMAGAAIFAPKLIWAVFCDFSIGLIAEATRRWFARKYYLLFGAVAAPAAMILLFWPATESHPWARALQISFALTAYMTAFASFSVPHLALGTELTTDRKGQSAVMGWRTGFQSLGLMCGGVLSPMLVQAKGGGAAAYTLMSVVLALICFFSLLTAFLGSKAEPRPKVRLEGGLHVGLFKAVLENRSFLFLIVGYFTQLIGQGCAYATESYLFVFSLGFAEPLKIMSYGIMLTVIAMLIAQPLLVWLTNRFGTKRTFQVASVTYSLSLAWMALGPTQTHLSIYLAAFSLGFTGSATIQSAYTRLSEVISAENARAGDRSRAGLYASMFVANDKIAFALGGALLAGVVLAAFGFIPGGADVHQTPMALKGITFAFAGIPAIFNVLAIILMGFSPDPAPSLQSAPVGVDLQPGTVAPAA